jgi:hypothetical protein
MDFSGEQPQYGVYRMLTSYLPPTLVKIVEKRKLNKIIITNTGIGAHEIPKNVFFAEDLVEGN